MSLDETLSIFTEKEDIADLIRVRSELHVEMFEMGARRKNHAVRSAETSIFKRRVLRCRFIINLTRIFSSERVSRISGIQGRMKRLFREHIACS